MSGVLGIFLLLMILLFLVAKFCKKRLRILLSLVIVLIALYCGIVYTDVSRVNSLKEPIFAKENGNMGSMIRYDGLGYTVGLEKDPKGNILYAQISMFGKIIAAVIT